MQLFSLRSLCRSAIIVFSVIFISSISTKAVAADITVTAPLNGTTVPSSLLLHPSAPTCGGQNHGSMAYSFDSNADNILSGQQSINQNVTAPSTGAHILRVKAWNVNGALCDTDVSITVSTANNNGLVPPANANAFSRIELLNNYTGG